MELSTNTGTFNGPRERLAMHGRSSLSDSELLAILLGTGSTAYPVSLLASRLLDEVGSLHGLARCGLAQLEAQAGIGLTKACRIHAAIELGARVHCIPLARRRPITSSRDIDAALRPRLAFDAREHFLAIALDAKNQPVEELEIAVGGLLACAITPADVFRPVLRAAAVSVIFVHNHPSGDPAPSEADIAITERLCRAGDLLGVPVLDHIVLGARGYFSFADAGLLTEARCAVMPARAP